MYILEIDNLDNNSKDLFSHCITSCKNNREKHGITLDEMAIITNWSKNTIRNFEKGISNNLDLYLKYYLLFRDYENK